MITKNQFLPFVRLNAQIRLSAYLKPDAQTELSARSVIYDNLIEPSTKAYKKKYIQTIPKKLKTKKYMYNPKEIGGYGKTLLTL